MYLKWSGLAVLLTVLAVPAWAGEGRSTERRGDAGPRAQWHEGREEALRYSPGARLEHQRQMRMVRFERPPTLQQRLHGERQSLRHRLELRHQRPDDRWGLRLHTPGRLIEGERYFRLDPRHPQWSDRQRFDGRGIAPHFEERRLAPRFEDRRIVPRHDRRFDDHRFDPRLDPHHSWQHPQPHGHERSQALEQRIEQLEQRVRQLQELLEEGG